MVLPGYYMLFAMNLEGVPSVARMIRITGSRCADDRQPGRSDHARGRAVSLAFSASAADRFAANGLPPGLPINSTSGVISGTPTSAGRYPSR